MDNKRKLFAGSALAVSITALATPSLVSSILERSEGTRFIGAGLVATNTLMAALPNVLSVIGGAYAMHKIHGWLYGDITSQIQKLNNDILALQTAQLEDRQRSINNISQALEYSQGASKLLEEIQPEVLSLRESHETITNHITSIIPLIQSIKDQVQALHEAASIENISVGSFRSSNDNNSEHSHDTPGNRGFAHAVSKRISEIGGLFAYPVKK